MTQLLSYWPLKCARPAQLYIGIIPTFPHSRLSQLNRRAADIFRLVLTAYENDWYGGTSLDHV